MAGPLVGYSGVAAAAAGHAFYPAGFTELGKLLEIVADGLRGALPMSSISTTQRGRPPRVWDNGDLHKSGRDRWV